MIVERDPTFNRGSILFWISAAFAGAVFLVGLFALIAPVPGSASFGAPVVDANNVQGLAWVRLMGVRDIGLAAVLFALLAVKAARMVGLMLLLVLIIPIVDCTTVILATGITWHVLVHGGAAITMAILGVLLLRRNAPAA